MKRYCLGFLISFDTNSVILLRKGKKLHVGKWNGLGGEIKEDETGPAAMTREFEEESLLRIAPHRWEDVGLLRGGPPTDPWEVEVFTSVGAFGPAVTNLCRPVGIDDRAYQVSMRHLPVFPLAPHTAALIAMSCDKLRTPTLPPLLVQEML